MQTAESHIRLTDLRYTRTGRTGQIAKAALRAGANINAQNYQVPLVDALYLPRLSLIVISQLLRISQGNTCLHYCFAYGYLELSDYLTSKGALDDIPVR